MDKRHPSSFQQLEKLGEGTYATVSHHNLDRRNALQGTLPRFAWHRSLAGPQRTLTDIYRCSKAATARPASLSH